MKSVHDVMDDISKGAFRIAENQETHVIDQECLSEAEKERYLQKLSFIREFKSLYGPSFAAYCNMDNKPEYNDLFRKYGFTRVLADRIVRRWLQSGMQDASLVDPRFFHPAGSKQYSYSKKTGRRPVATQGVIITDDVRKAFDYGVQQYCSQRLITKREAYMKTIRHFFVEEKDGEVRLLPADRRPTERQFLNYLNKMVSKEEEAKIKTSNIEYRNNERLLLGSPRDEAMRPGYILEADALEIDINIVSTIDTTRNVSRPILYLMIDMYSHAIVAFHVGFDNNSILGLSSLMLNLFEDRQAILDRKGVSYDISAWPSPFIPNEIRCDRGSDFASDQFERMCQDLNIIRTLETGAMGSMKGLIEQSFRLFHQGIKPQLEDKGIIQKRYDSNHKLEACLTIEDMFKLMVEFIRFHNTFYTKGFRLSKEMITEGVGKRPIDIWNYGISHFGPPEPVTPFNQLNCMFSLMLDATASITREGISFRRLLYVNRADENLLTKMKMARLNANRRNSNGERINSMDIRFDPRSINAIYYLKDGRLQVMELLSSKCGNLHDLTWDEYEEYARKEKSMDKEGYELNIVNRMKRMDAVASVAAGATRTTYADPGNIRISRKAEKALENFNDRIENRLPSLLDASTPEEMPTTPEITIATEENTRAEEVRTDANCSLFSPECPPELADF